MPKAKKIYNNIYEVLPNLEGVSEDLKKEVADKIFASYDPEKQTLLVRLLFGSIPIDDRDYVRGRSFLANFKKKYEAYFLNIEDKLKDIIQLAQSLLGIRLNKNNLSLKKQDFLVSSLDTLEQKVKSELKMDRGKYQELFLETVRDILKENPSLDLQNAVITIINSIYQFLIDKKAANDRILIEKNRDDAKTSISLDDGLSERKTKINQIKDFQKKIDDLVSKEEYEEAIRLKFKSLEPKDSNSIIPSEVDEFKRDLKAFYNSCLIKYRFLRASSKAWNNIFIKALAYSLNSPLIMSEAVRRINNIIGKTIKKRFDSEKTRITLIDDIIKFYPYENNSAGAILHYLIDLLGEFKLTISEGLFYELKEKSSMFKFLLEKLKMSDFSFQEFNDYVNGCYANYIQTKPASMSFRDAILETNKLLGLINYSESEIKNSKGLIDKELLDRVKFILNNKQSLNKIYELLGEIFGIVDKKAFWKAIMLVDFTCLNDVVQGLFIYEHQSNKDLTFIISFKNRVNSLLMSETDKNEGKKVLGIGTSFPKINEVSVSYYSKTKSIYDCFPLDPRVGEDVRKKVVDNIINSLPKDKKAFALGSKTFASEGEKHNFFNPLRVKYNRIIDRYLNPVDVYDYFASEDAVLPSLRNQLVDQLFDYYGVENKEKAIRALKGDINQDFDEAQNVMRLLGDMKKVFDSTIKRYNDHKTIIDMCESPFNERISPETKREIVEEILAVKAQGREEELQKYVGGTQAFVKEHGIELYRLIKLIRDYYNKMLMEVWSLPIWFKEKIKKEFGVDIKDDLNMDICYHLYGDLRRIEDFFQKELAMSSSEYKEYKLKKVKELFMENPQASLYELILNYIYLGYLEMKSLKGDELNI